MTDPVRAIDIAERIDAAIASFVEEHGSIQHSIALPESDYDRLYEYVKAGDDKFGFLKYGLAYCTLPVTKCSGDDIAICAKTKW
jgi:hypothetical protein